MADHNDENVPSAVRAQESMVSDDAVMKATGRTREEWFELLDEAGARHWDHATIARWMGGKHEVDAWWAQGVTVSYEQSRGLRAPGQAKDGSFTVNSSKTLSAKVSDVWPYLADDQLRRDWLDLELQEVAQSEKSIRFDGGERTRVALNLDATPPTKSGRPRCKISINHMRLGREAVPETKQFWQDALERLAALFRD
ncbi:hypothetical protein [Flaviflexus huanghaiensis]|uniref:hypothetical protein n=1 Tax=Flaviflexus huanghaiensis TaxID=1111473 RepID=UPI0015FA6ED5|nr:hypothetical protein [Flaviflexus huanghaiensis]